MNLFQEDRLGWDEGGFWWDVWRDGWGSGDGGGKGMGARGSNWWLGQIGWKMGQDGM